MAAVNRSDELASLREGARRFDLILETAQADALLQLIDELERANAEFNLTAIRDRPGMLTKHLLDSLSVQPYLSRRAHRGRGDRRRISRTAARDRQSRSGTSR